MASKRLRFAIFGNVFQAKKSASIRRVLDVLADYGADVSMDKAFHDFITSGYGARMAVRRVFTGNDFSSDFVISMGGDGTFLKAAARVGAKQIPIIGVNMGRMGFLANVSPDGIEPCLMALHSGDYDIDDRSVLLADIGREATDTVTALNDVAILKRDDASMITIRAHINGQYLTTYQADGLIVSTPTGSTAYSLSNGGPVIAPGTPVFSLTAVAPHSLNVRPIVISDDSVVTLRVESRSHNFLIAVDGRSEKCAEGTTISLRKAPYRVRIVKHPGQSYFDTLRKKMMWGIDVRE